MEVSKCWQLKEYCFVPPIKYTEIFTVLSYKRNHRDMIDYSNLSMSWKLVQCVWFGKWFLYSNLYPDHKLVTAAQGKKQASLCTSHLRNTSSRTLNMPKTTRGHPFQVCPSTHVRHLRTWNPQATSSSQWCRKHPLHILGPHHLTISNTHPYKAHLILLVCYLSRRF